MKKPILLLQFRTDKSQQHEVDSILKTGKLRKKDLTIINILDSKSIIPKPEDLNNFQAVITGASGQFNVTDWPDNIRVRIEKLYPFFDEIIKRDFPMLAICFGHQLFAALYGGEVRSDKKQSETGTLPVILNNEGQKSIIFQNCPRTFHAVLGHKDSVTKLPKGALSLASSEKCKFQSYKLKNNIYSTQFHPELDRDGLTWRICLYPEYTKGKTVSEIKKSYKPIPHASKVIENFVKSYK